MKTCQLVTMAVFALALGLRSTFGEPDLWAQNDHYYDVVTTGAPILWTDARDAAASQSWLGMPGHLVTVTSAQENAFIVSAEGNAIVDRWMGGYQDHSAPGYSEPAGGWKWITGEPWQYTNWGSGQPDNYNGNEDYLNFIGPSWPLGTWNDFPSAGNPGPQMYGYVIEYEAPVPEPATLSLLALGGLALLRRRR